MGIPFLVKPKVYHMLILIRSMQSQIIETNQICIDQTIIITSKLIIKIILRYSENLKECDLNLHHTEQNINLLHHHSEGDKNFQYNFIYKEYEI